MAIKGPAYVKTTWAFEERPVASSKLNTWDDRLEGALELLFLLVKQLWGGQEGVVRGATAYDLQAVALGTPGLSVEVKPGYALIGGYPFKLAAATETVDVTAPSSQDRIDLVQVDLETWGATVKTGTESSSPSAPAPDTDCIAVAALYLRPGMASIKNADDGTNGYILDKRSFL